MSSGRLAAVGKCSVGLGCSQRRREVAPRRVSRRLRCVTRAAKTDDGPTVAIVGVTGAVGQEFLRVRKNFETWLVEALLILS